MESHPLEPPVPLHGSIALSGNITNCGSLTNPGLSMHSGSRLLDGRRGKATPMIMAWQPVGNCGSVRRSLTDCDEIFEHLVTESLSAADALPVLRRGSAECRVDLSLRINEHVQQTPHRNDTHAFGPKP